MRRKELPAMNEVGWLRLGANALYGAVEDAAERGDFELMASLEDEVAELDDRIEADESALIK